MNVISNASRTFTQTEKNYYLHSAKLGFLALKWAITNKFRDYFYYAEHFTVFSDNNPMMTPSKFNASVMRWVSELSK